MAFLSKNSAPIIVRDVNLIGLGLLKMGLVSAGAGTGVRGLTGSQLYHSEEEEVWRGREESRNIITNCSLDAEPEISEN